MALGAEPGGLPRMIVLQGMIPVLVGVALGAVASFALTRFLASVLFEVTPTDATTFRAAAFTLVGVSAAACYLPARRSARVNPVIALRNN